MIQRTLPVAATLAALGLPALAQDTTLGVADMGTYGEYLTGPDGRPLYMFTTDTQGDGADPVISCTSQECLTAWPLITVEGDVTVGEGLDQSLAGTMEHEGRTVVTYNGWPLYAFQRDLADQPPQGQDIGSFGGEWYLVDPQGEPIEGSGA
ncbi:COG4315 family predicted lipoprotein [Roseicyclus sp.]|uniref:COG4315 family predicted lipoprotein n=1 Tax=Roseicyclus sp. TaxID=1914329 RepID=UPI003F9F8200